MALGSLESIACHLPAKQRSAPRPGGNARSLRAPANVETPVTPILVDLVTHTDRAHESDHTSNPNLRQTIHKLGADAAIITFSRSRPVLRRHAYLIGFDAYKQQPAKTSTLLDLAEKCWAVSHDRAHLQIVKQELHAIMPDAARESFGCPAESYDALLAEFDHLAFSVHHVDTDGCLQIALFRKADAGPFDQTLPFALSLVQPMLAEVAGAQIDAERAQRRIGILEGMLDTVSHGVIMLDSKARPFYFNDVARSLVADTGVLQVGNDQILRCRTLDLTHQLHRSVQLAVHGHDEAEEIIVKLQGRDGAQMLGFLIPAHGRDKDPGNRAAILMVHQMKIHGASPALMKAFGLLPSEQRFLATFLDAPSLSEAAIRLALSEETARTYLKRICAKLGVRRQVELASLMFGLAPPIRRRQPGGTFVAA